jgi:hypothetical protein
MTELLTNVATDDVLDFRQPAAELAGRIWGDLDRIREGQTNVDITICRRVKALFPVFSPRDCPRILSGSDPVVNGSPARNNVEESTERPEEPADFTADVVPNAHTGFSLGATSSWSITAVGSLARCEPSDASWKLG